MHALAKGPVDAENFDALIFGGAEPMREPGVELRHFTARHRDVVFAQPQGDPDDWRRCMRSRTARAPKPGATHPWLRQL